MWLPGRLGTVLNTKVIAYKNLFLPALIVFAIVPPLLAGEPSMTKIVSRIISDSVPEGSFASKPKTLYRAGNKYSRTEEELDVENNLHALLIVNEPDTWMINLADKTARHIVDPGPTFNFRAPIVWIPSRNGQPEAIYLLIAAGADLVWAGYADPWKKPPGFERVASAPQVSLLPLDITNSRAGGRGSSCS